MRKWLLVAALLASTGAAHAGDVFSFEINGQRVRIERPRNCTALSCLNISAPGLTNSKDDDASAATPAPAPVPSPSQAPANQQASIAAPAASSPAVASSPSSTPSAAIPPLPAQANTASGTVTTLPAPATDTQAQQPTAATAPAQNQVVAAAPAQPPVQPEVTAPAPQAVANSPLGVWMTEKNEGKVHIVNCGVNLCGYAVNAKTGADGEQVLINMKPGDGGWHGRIHDTRGGGTYDSTIAMRGNDRLRVQGCAFGGMFCGGQTWSRLN